MNSKDSSLARSFTALGTTEGFLRWMSFRDSLANDDQLKVLKKAWQARSIDPRFLKDKAVLNLWLQEPEPAVTDHDETRIEQGLFLNHARLAVVLLVAVALVFGISTMLAALSYSGDKPVNVWALLAVFAIIPFVFSAFLFLRSLMPNAFTKRGSFGFSQSLIAGMSRLFGSEKRVSTQPHSAVWKAWLLWKMQSVAVAFQIGAILTFLLGVIFQDIAFAWSSTVIEGGEWMHGVFRYLALPWSWFAGAPSAEFIEQSRHFRAENIQQAKMLGQWWSYLCLAMLFYGLLPRLALAVFLRNKCKRALLKEIENSGEVQRFLLAMRHADNDDVAATSVSRPSGAIQKIERLSLEDLIEAIEPMGLDPSKMTLLAWKTQSPQSEKVLGLDAWDKDKQFIAGHAADWKSQIVLLSNCQTTPTAELADVIQLILDNKASVKVTLVLENINGDTLATSEAKKRFHGQLISWNAFASKHNIPLAKNDN